MTRTPDRPDNPPSLAEIAALTARLRALSNAGATADPAERARFLADKDRLLDRIGAASSRAEPRSPMRGRDNHQPAAAADTALDDAVAARAEMGGYALVGPSACTWRTDPDTGRLLEPVSEAEHRTLRGLLGAEAVTTTEPAWTDTPDGQDVVSAVIPLGDEHDAWTEASDELGMTGAKGPPIDAGPALTAEEAAHDLAADGRSLAEARVLVRDYLDDVSEHVGASAHQWGLDGADLDAIRTSAALPEPSHGRPPDGETERRDQLATWHAEADDDTDAADDALDSGQEVTR